MRHGGYKAHLRLKKNNVGDGARRRKTQAQ